MKKTAHKSHTYVVCKFSDVLLLEFAEWKGTAGNRKHCQEEVAHCSPNLSPRISNPVTL